MIDLSELMDDPDFCEPFIIRRRCGTWVDGIFVSENEDKKVIGIVEPTTGMDLETLPEADKVSGVMTFYSKEMIMLGTEEQQGDEIICRGNRYKVLQIQDWSRHGFYKCIAALSGRNVDGLSESL